MSDFDELMEYYFTEVIGEVIDNLPYDGELVENVQETIQSVWDKLSSSNFEIDDEHKEVLIHILAEALNLSPDAVSEQLDIVTNVNTSSLTEKISEVALDDNNTWDGICIDAIGCWDECIVTVDNPSKRLTCGYHS